MQLLIRFVRAFARELGLIIIAIILKPRSAAMVLAYFTVCWAIDEMLWR